MKLRTVLTLNSILALAVSIGLVLVPSGVISIFGSTTDAAGLLLARHYGAAGVALGVLAWLARNISAQEAKRLILPALLSVFLIEFVVDLLAQISGMLNVLGWSLVVLDLLFASAYGYFLFVKVPHQ